MYTFALISFFFCESCSSRVETFKPNSIKIKSRAIENLDLIQNHPLSSAYSGKSWQSWECLFINRWNATNRTPQSWAGPPAPRNSLPNSLHFLVPLSPGSVALHRPLAPLRSVSPELHSTAAPCVNPLCEDPSPCILTSGWCLPALKPHPERTVCLH